jgi:hypothetical protein
MTDPTHGTSMYDTRRALELLLEAHANADLAFLEVKRTEAAATLADEIVSAARAAGLSCRSPSDTLPRREYMVQAEGMHVVDFTANDDGISLGGTRIGGLEYSAATGRWVTSEPGGNPATLVAEALVKALLVPR